MQTNPWKKQSSKTVYKTAWLSLQEDQVITPAGKEGTYTFIHSNPAVFIVAMTSEKQVYLAGQWRYPTDIYSWELPGGGSDGEDVEQAAKRELQEETGITAKTWTHVGKMQSLSGLSDEFFHVFLAEDLDESAVLNQEEEGITTLVTKSWSELWELIKSGELHDSQTIAALTRAALYLEVI